MEKKEEDLESIYNKFNTKLIKYGLQVKKSDTDKILKKVKNLRLNIKNFDPVKNKDNNYNIIITKFNLNQKDELLKELDNVENFELLEEELNLTHNNFSIEDILKNILPKNINELPGSYEMIGNIAHLNLREKFLDYKYIIGKIILDKNPSVKTVINKVSKIDNIYRTYDMEILAGKDNYQVKHKEGNCLFEFDIRKVYWCSRLQTERDRILKRFKKGQVVCDAFCGVGPLSIRAAKIGIKVIANDLNPECYHFINKNIILNKINEKQISTFNMDAREFIKSCINQSKYIKDEDENIDNNIPMDTKIDHFYMNLPKDAIEFLDVFIGLFKNTKKEIYDKNNLPLIHIYAFSNAKDPKDDIKQRISKALDIETLDNKYLVEFIDVRDISTRKHVYCVSFILPSDVAYK